MRSTWETYTELKDHFIDKFATVEAWGDWVSQKRVTAFSEVLAYLDASEELLEEDEELRDLIYSDNIAILSGKLIAMPSDQKDSSAESANS